MTNHPVLYDEAGLLTDEGQKVDTEFMALLVPIFTAAVDRGVPVRELGHLLIHCVATVELMFLLKEEN